MTNQELYDLIYARDNQMPSTSDPQFLGLLDRAIVNVRSELKTFEPDAFEVFLENQSMTDAGIAYPSDFVRDDDPLFYRKDEQEIPIPRNEWYDRAGRWYAPTYSIVSIQYSKDIARQTSIAANLPFVTRKAEEILISELMALIYATNDENEATNSYTNSLQQSNRIR